MTWTLIIILILVGFLFLLLEILVLPGTSVAGIIGFVLIGIGVYFSFRISSTAGYITLGSSLVMSVVFLMLVLKSRTWKKLTLKSEIDGKVNVIEEDQVKVGDTGVTVSRLAPAGKAMINNDYFEVHTIGEFVDPNIEIIVTKIEFNKIYVKLKNNT
jgi:membrane-bound ClpP family serine protease